MVTVNSRDNCPYCTQAKQLLEGYGIAYKEVHQPTGMVPQILVHDELIGGYTELLQLSYDEDKWNGTFGANV